MPPRTSRSSKWETMKEIGPHELKYKDRTVSGKTIELELTSGAMVRVWRADNGQKYFCHGLTFGGKEALGGVISPLGDHRDTGEGGRHSRLARCQRHRCR